METEAQDSREVPCIFLPVASLRLSLSHKAQQKYSHCKLSGSFLNSADASRESQSSSSMSHTHTHTVFILPYVFRLHGCFLFLWLNTHSIIHVAAGKPVLQRMIGGSYDEVCATAG